MLEKTWSRRRYWIIHIRVFRFNTYAMVPHEEKAKLGAKGMKYFFLDYYEGTKHVGLYSYKPKISSK